MPEKTVERIGKRILALPLPEETKRAAAPLIGRLRTTALAAAEDEPEQTRAAVAELEKTIGGGGVPPGLRERLHAFETGHPDFVEAVNSVCLLLSGIGL